MMPTIALLATAVALTCSLTQATKVKKNAVFVHGLAGFGPDELLGIGYWGFGGSYYLKEFDPEEWNVFEASVGPVSSNWDRACELYAQIKGGVTDYGKTHSETYDHKRYATRDYPGFVPDWSPENPVHLFGHSMGGQTIRMLEILMQEGDAAERENTDENDLSDLFKGGHSGWIKSITGVSAPFDGTTYMDIQGEDWVEMVKNLVVFFASLGGLDGNEDEFLYDFDLDHFGLERVDGESFWDYYARLGQSKVFEKGYKDVCAYDVSIQGAAEINMRGKQSYPGTYYFSIVTEQTHRGLWPFHHNKHYPDVDMILPMQATARQIGTYGGNWGGWNDWHENDGLVPTISQECPKVGYSDEFKYCSERFVVKELVQPGSWYKIPLELDHCQIMGVSLIYDARDTFRSHSETLAFVHNRDITGDTQAKSVPSADLPGAPADVTSDGLSNAVVAVVGAVAGIAVGAVVATMLVKRAHRQSAAQQTAPQEKHTNSVVVLSSDNPAFGVEPEGEV